MGHNVARPTTYSTFQIQLNNPIPETAKRREIPAVAVSVAVPTTIDGIRFLSETGHL